MAHNPVENAFLYQAIQMLERPYRKAYPGFRGHFGLGSGVTFMVIEDGEDVDKLTVAIQSGRDPNHYIPDPNIEPVDCYNLIRPDEDLATAVARVFG